jgi:Fe-S-cluster-containing hydrogenase component 2
MQNKDGIEIHPEKCTKCYCCQLACSFLYTGAFNPEEARIIVDPPAYVGFTDECREGCSACARYCPNGALSRKGKGRQ